MNADDFVQQPRGNRPFDTWLSRQPIATPMGDFLVDLEEAPDATLLRQADALALYLDTNIEAIWEKVYAHYRRVEAHPTWMARCGVPTGLDRLGILPYLRARRIRVEREDGGLFFLDPLWDPEHKIHLRLEEGVLTFADA